MTANHRLVRATAGRYPFVLAIIGLDVVALLALPGSEIWLVLTATLTAATLVLAVLAAQAADRVVQLSLVAGILGIASAVGQVLIGADWLEAITWASFSALIVGAMIAIGADVLRATEVTRDTLFAAVCFYALIGLAFAFAALAVNAATGSFFVQEGPHPPADFVYFSYVVLTTLGFGDLGPAGQLPRAMVILEAIAGPMFLVTALARLVSLYAAPRQND